MVKKNTISKMHGVGRRKSSVARVWLQQGKGLFQINGRPYEQYFSTDAARAEVLLPLETMGVRSNFDISVNVVGGGVSGQAGAVRLGVSRALLETGDELRPALKKNGLLTVDSRTKERKKYGQKGARGKFQFVKR